MSSTVRRAFRGFPGSLLNGVLVSYGTHFMYGFIRVRYRTDTSRCTSTRTVDAACLADICRSSPAVPQSLRRVYCCGAEQGIAIHSDLSQVRRTFTARRLLWRQCCASSARLMFPNSCNCRNSAIRNRRALS